MGKHKHKKQASDSEAEEEEGERMETTATEEPSERKDERPASKPYEELVELVSVIAKPMASRKLTKKLHKIVKKSQKAKQLKRGVREVVKSLRKNEKGVVILAGDVSPIDVISHIPVYCEDKCVPYVYVPSRRNLGEAAITKRPTSVVLVKASDDYKELYDYCHSTVTALPIPH